MCIHCSAPPAMLYMRVRHLLWLARCRKRGIGNVECTFEANNADFLLLLQKGHYARCFFDTSIQTKVFTLFPAHCMCLAKTQQFSVCLPFTYSVLAIRTKKKLKSLQIDFPDPAWRHISRSLLSPPKTKVPTPHSKLIAS